MPGSRKIRALQAQSAYYAVTGVWPLLSRRTFEALTGKKQDWWLVQMVGLLALTSGIAIGVGARSETPSRETLTLSVLCAFSFTAIDVAYVLRRRISPVYLADALAEIALATALCGRE
jgi:hypothetical protein